MLVRRDDAANYKAVFFNGKTIRQRIDPLKPIITPRFAEIEDIAINSKCLANCPYCYTSATKSGSNFSNIVEKAQEVWGTKPLNNRPFQIAIGGAGESTMHPDWVKFVTAVRNMDIMPNYTTNGMHLTEEVLRATEEVCGGVAVSYHPHIKKVFTESIDKLSKINTKLNTHVIIGDKKSLDDLKEMYETFRDSIEYFVVLPYQAVGRGSYVDTHETWVNMFSWINSLEKENQNKFAFGALFYNWMMENNYELDINLYEPEIYSGYRMMDDSYKTLRVSSYDLKEKVV